MIVMEYSPVHEECDLISYLLTRHTVYLFPTFMIRLSRWTNPQR